MRFSLQQQKSPGKQAPGENLLTDLLTTRKKRRYFPLSAESSSTDKGVRTLTQDSTMVSNKQAPGRGIRARNQAAIRIGGEQGRAATCVASYRVSRPAVFLGGSHDE